MLHAAVAAADPYTAVRHHLHRHAEGSHDWLAAGAERYDLAQVRRVLVLAVGKAALPMARAALDVLGSRVDGGLVVPKATPHSAPAMLASLPVLPAAHPVPDERSLLAGRRAVELLEGAGEHDLVLALL